MTDPDELLAETAKRPKISQARILEELVLRYAGRIGVTYPK